MRKKNKIKITINGKQTIINSNFSLKNLVDKLEIPLNKIVLNRYSVYIYIYIYIDIYSTSDNYPHPRGSPSEKGIPPPRVIADEGSKKSTPPGELLENPRSSPRGDPF